MRNQIWTISTLVRYLKNSLDNDMNIQSILVKGEISNFTHHRSNHLYFSLKDGNAKMNCVMFSSNVSRLKFIPKDGMQVIVRAKVSLYEVQGNLQLYVSEMQSDGIGDLYLQFETLKEKLWKEGLFDESHKKKLPIFPKSIGIISAKTGAAIQDVLSIIARRWPLAEVSVYASLVQGEAASQMIMQQLKEADQQNHDVILLVRGGGSWEDLWCFNDEMLARTIYQMNTVVVCGVGHETDTTLVDYVCDQRAPTPSAAAELVTPDYLEIKDCLSVFEQRLLACIKNRFEKERKRFELLQARPLFQNPEYFIQNDKMRLIMAVKSLYSMEHYIEKKAIQLKEKEKLLYDNIKKNLEHTVQRRNHIVALLDAYSPLKILSRGYSIAMKGKNAIRSIYDVSEKDQLSIIVDDGIIQATVEKKVKNNE